MELATSIFAVVGALYTLALAIVKLTPTPRDDAALAKVSPWLQGLAKLFGLDLKQGIASAPASQVKLLAPVLLPALFAVALVASVAGCTTARSTPQSQYVAAAHTYAVTVQALTTAQQAGQLNPDNLPAITAAVHTGRELLDAWAAALAAGQDAPDLAASLQGILAQLAHYYQATLENPR